MLLHFQEWAADLAKKPWRASGIAVPMRPAGLSLELSSWPENRTGLFFFEFALQKFLQLATR
jgi:hypothetical protein